MRYSFQRRLLVYLGISVGLFCALGAAAQFFLAASRLRAFQDDILRQVAALALAHPGHDASAFGPLRLGDTDARIRVALLPVDAAPAWFHAGWTDGLHGAEAAQGPLRVLVRRQGGYTAVVAQAVDARNDLAEDAAWHALIPSVALLPLLLWAVGILVRRLFEPIAAAATQIALRGTANPMPLRIDGLPDEIEPFVAAIDDLLQRTDRLARQQQRFVADAAHELRTPLTALALQATNVRNADSLERARERLVALERGIARAGRLCQQLLDLASIDGQAVESRPLEVCAWAREFIGGWHKAARRRGIDLGLDAPEEACAQASAVLLQMSLGNAVDNALKYTPPGGQVTLAIEALAQGVRCEVSDTGPGIAAADRAAAFKPFHRLHGNDIEGTGLGLAIALEAARRMGATLTLHDARAGSGLVFRLDLPPDPAQA
ncbi:MAG: hypothetical protein KGL18_08930 [Burkholderiales bacterium]|nr:hypothetical protein [Burkholderiales bacterium]MBU6501868.1 hypothetical protein [Burkholderiales bacterium]MDE2157593.1 hypothetical protein [Burkholderiales bacterium]MDE2503083.1 hypothetical protein [Burkholderiales bacterium]